MTLLNKKVLIIKGRQKGVEGYVLYECDHAVCIQALGMFGDTGYCGKYYERKTNLKVMK